MIFVIEATIAIVIAAVIVVLVIADAFVLGSAVAGAVDVDTVFISFMNVNIPIVVDVIDAVVVVIVFVADNFIIG